MNKTEYRAEVDKLATLPPATVEIPPVEALALITLVQAGMMSDRGIAQHGFTQIAVAGAKKLQSLLDKDSEICKALEDGWDAATNPSRPSVDDVIPPIESTDF